MGCPFCSQTSSAIALPRARFLLVQKPLTKTRTGLTPPRDPAVHSDEVLPCEALSCRARGSVFVWAFGSVRLLQGRRTLADLNKRRIHIFLYRKNFPSVHRMYRRAACTARHAVSLGVLGAYPPSGFVKGLAAQTLVGSAQPRETPPHRRSVQKRRLRTKWTPQPCNVGSSPSRVTLVQAPTGNVS